MKRLELHAKTVAAAQEEIARQMGVPASRIRYEILEEPKAGFLGMGGRPALVRGTLQEGRGDVAKVFVKEFFQRLGVDTVVIARMEDDRLAVSADGDFAWFNGPRGEALDAFQQLVNVVAQRAVERGEVEGTERITVDLGGFRERRRLELERLAAQVAEKVMASGEAVTLEPMSPPDRRILHITLEAYPGLTTRSEGEEPHRRVVVEPVEKATEGEEPS